MEIRNYLNNKRNLQNAILKYLESEDDVEENYQNLIQIINDQKIKENRRELKEFLNLTVKIANNHHRDHDFNEKIQQIILYFSDYITKFFINSDIFNIFQENKLILLFLIEQQILVLDKYTIDELTQKKYEKYFYVSYFAPELKSFEDKINNEKVIKEIEKVDLKDYTQFNQNRKKGQNESHICEMIRDDLIDEFIVYVNKEQISLKKEIQPSYFETNLFLLDSYKYKSGLFYFTNKIEKLNIIDYSAFFGAVQIFRYLYLNYPSKIPENICQIAIHGCNPELILFLEENELFIQNKSYFDCLIESIKCHHNDIANYFIENHSKKIGIENQNLMIRKSLKYYNYAFFKDDFDYKTVFYYMCKYNYASFVELLLKNEKIDVNAIKMSKGILNEHILIIFSNKLLFLCSLKTNF